MYSTNDHGGNYWQTCWTGLFIYFAVNCKAVIYYACVLVLVSTLAFSIHGCQAGDLIFCPCCCKIVKILQQYPLHFHCIAEQEKPWLCRDMSRKWGRVGVYFSKYQLFKYRACVIKLLRTVFARAAAWTARRRGGEPWGGAVCWRVDWVNGDLFPQRRLLKWLLAAAQCGGGQELPPSNQHSHSDRCRQVAPVARMSADIWVPEFCRNRWKFHRFLFCERNNTA